ncbi:PDZ domain-containing protein [Streptomyces sp. NPDC056835]|uniref:PDZ domain-containing protein n=1 Tax=Streptomyces sp. NPDC056835 TaxID=3345956 RepID=UPI003689BEB0
MFPSRSLRSWALASLTTAVLLAGALPAAAAHPCTTPPGRSTAAAATAGAGVIPAQQNVPELDAPGAPGTVVFPPDKRSRPGPGRFTVTAPLHTRITALGMRCLGNGRCSVAIAADGSTATVTLPPGRWTFANPVHVTLRATPDAPLSGGQYAGSFAAGGEAQPLNVVITEGIQGALGITRKDTPDRSGALVASVVPGGAADTAGIRTGDVITAFNDTPVSTANELRDARLGKLRESAVVPVTYRRPDGTVRTVQVTLT